MSNLTGNVTAVTIHILTPAGNSSNSTMSPAAEPGVHTFMLTSFERGVFAYTAYADLGAGGSLTSAGVFEVTADLFINIQTIKRLYGDAERVTVTDPPGANP